MNKYLKAIKQFFSEYSYDIDKIDVKTEQVKDAIVRFLKHNEKSYNITDKYTIKMGSCEDLHFGYVTIVFKGTINKEYDVPLTDLNLASSCDNCTRVNVHVMLRRDGNLEFTVESTAPNSEDVSYCINHLETFVYSLKSL